MSIRIFCFLLGLGLLSACQDEPPDVSATADKAINEQSEQVMAKTTGTELEVYKDPSCGCCAEWISYMDERGYKSNIHHPDDLSQVKLDLKIRPQYQSCHTTVTEDGSVFEGHIPAKYIEQFLAEKPEGAIGLAVPGMPLGSPGMEVGDRFMAYDVLLLKEDGSSEVYGRVNSPSEQY